MDANKFFELSTIIDSFNLKIVFLLAIGFALAALLGYISWSVRLSPILGYLLAGYLIGPYSPGFVADVRMAEQLSEIGVILMMFGVGLDFKLHDLIQVRKIAIPGAVGQTVLAAVLSAVLIHWLGWSWITGLTIGLAIAVASTVVLVRMLSENHLLKTQDGHIAVGWLIVEDIITVLILLLLPSLSTVIHTETFALTPFLISLGWVAAKFIFLAVLIFYFGKTTVSFLLTKVLRTHSHELFTLATLALVFFITMGTTLFFGISIALGAFIAGMVVRQTKVHQKALLHSLPMRDAFIAIFFLSVGMLFNPPIIVEHFTLFITVLAVILIAKPITAILLTCALRYPFKTAISVAVALAQIGEFSFILSEESLKFNLMPDLGYDIIVACALVSIAINPIIFKLSLKMRDSF